MNQNSSLKLVFIVTLLVLTSVAGILNDTEPETSSMGSPHLSEQQESKIIQNLGYMKGWFTENRGQIQNHDVCLVYTGSDYSIAFVERGYFIKFSGEENSSSMVMVTFEGANSVVPEGREKLTHESNYFIGNDSSGWRTKVSNYNKIIYEEIYDGIDLMFYTTKKGLKYEFVVQPFKDPDEIRIGYHGVETIEIDSEGELIISTETKILKEERPYSYQNIGGKEFEVPSEYEVQNNIVSIKTGAYDTSSELIIDPLIYSSFIGGGHDEGFRWQDIILDADNNAYIVGYTWSTDFPTTPGCYDDSYKGDTRKSNLFVCKLSSNGSDLRYSTFLGGSNTDSNIQGSIAIDDENNVFIVGHTQSSDFPTTPDCYDDSYDGGSEVGGDIFVTKLDSEGANLVYSTFIGGNDDEVPWKIVLDYQNNAYVTGYTTSSDFPTTAGCFDDSLSGGCEAFILKLSSDGSELVYSTYIGGGGTDTAWGISLDSETNAYITGGTKSTDFPTSTGCYDDSYNGGSDEFDIYVCKLNEDGSNESVS